jgi:hypothetical protein
LDVLQELTAAIRANGGPEYGSATDRDGADYRGISCAFLFRRDRVKLSAPSPLHPVYGGNHGIDLAYPGHRCNGQTSNPKAINGYLQGDQAVFSRSPQAARFEIRSPDPQTGPVTVHCVNNHFKSNPGKYVDRRRAQASLVAAIYRTLAANDPTAHVVVGGDLNVFPRPDEPLPESHPLHPSDQLAQLYEAGLHNLHDDILRAAPASAYTYVYRGVAQTLDHLYVNEVLRGKLASVHAVHVNSDYAPHYPGAEARGLSDHDPVLAVFRF